MHCNSSWSGYPRLWRQECQYNKSMSSEHWPIRGEHCDRSMYAVETGFKEAWRTRRSCLTFCCFYKRLEVTVRVNNAPREQERGNHTFKHTKTLLGRILKKMQRTNIHNLTMFTASGLGFIVAGNKQRYTVAKQTCFKVKGRDCIIGLWPKIKTQGKIF